MRGTTYETVMPILGPDDIERCRKTVQTIIEKSQATGEAFEDEDFAPYRVGVVQCSGVVKCTVE
jgi:hypothetical protein